MWSPWRCSSRISYRPIPYRVEGPISKGNVVVTGASLIHSGKVSEMLRAISVFFRREEGQDLADYCLLTALVALMAGAILFHVSGGLNSIWSIGSQSLNGAGATVESNGLSHK